MDSFQTPRRATGGKLPIGSLARRIPRGPRGELLRSDAGRTRTTVPLRWRFFPNLAAFCVQIPTGRLYQYNSQT